MSKASRRSTGTHSTSRGRLMQLNNVRSLGNGAIRSSFSSLLRFGGRWHVDAPYFCYAHDHRVRTVPFTMSIKLDCIMVRDHVRIALRSLRGRLFIGMRKISSAPNRCVQYFADRKSRMDFENRF